MLAAFSRGGFQDSAMDSMNGTAPREVGLPGKVAAIHYHSSVNKNWNKIKLV